MEVYTALYDKEGKQIADISAEIITEQSFENMLGSHKIFFFGNGAAKCSSVITHPNADFSKTYCHSARYMVQPALQAYVEKRFEDVAYFEPYYLKDFIAGPKKKT
jgi:tRNA threonylcarbamoyladenosine biosynthesis protein TsaB